MTADETERRRFRVGANGIRQPICANGSNLRINCFQTANSNCRDWRNCLRRLKAAGESRTASAAFIINRSRSIWFSRQRRKSAMLCRTCCRAVPMNQWFCTIVTDGTGGKFEISHNQDWLEHTRPILEAFFHAHFFLKMAVKYGQELPSAPDSLPSGWAAMLYLFNLR